LSVLMTKSELIEILAAASRICAPTMSIWP
jgi:hypothetical protein